MDRGQYFSKLSTDETLSILHAILFIFGAYRSPLFDHLTVGILKPPHSPLNQQAS
jgi:hypothetical protein